jgi:hypothetical protein
VVKSKTLPEVLPTCPDRNAKPGQGLHDNFGRTFRPARPDMAAAAKGTSLGGSNLWRVFRRPKAYGQVGPLASHMPERGLPRLTMREA